MIINLNCLFCQEPITIHGYYTQQQEQQQEQQRQYQQQQLFLHQQQQQQQPQQEQQQQPQQQGSQLAQQRQIQSNINLNVLNKKLNTQFRADLDYYLVHKNLPSYVTKTINSDKISIESLLAIDIFAEPHTSLPNPVISPSIDLYHSVSEYNFLLDINKYTIQSNHHKAKALTKKIANRSEKLLAMEKERHNREVIAYNTLPHFGSFKHKLINIKNHGEYIFNDIENRFRNNLPTPFFSNDAIQMSKMLFALNIQSAAKLSNQNSRIHLSMLKEYNINPKDIAKEYLKSAESILSFAKGVANGVVLTSMSTINGVVSITKFSYNLINNPYETIEEVWGHISNMEADRIAYTVKYYLEKNYKTFVNGSAEDRGEIIGQIATDIILGATGASFLSNIKKFSSGFGKTFMNKIEFLSDFYKPTLNEVGALGNINKQLERIVIKRPYTVVFNRSQLQSKLKHSKDIMNLTSPLTDSNHNINLYKQAILNNMKANTTLAIKGTYDAGNISNKLDVIHYYNKANDVNIVIHNGKFLTGFKLGVEQIKNLMQTGNIR